MTDQAKLAEIRKRHAAAMDGDGEEPRPLTEDDWAFVEHAWLDVGFLLSELERKDGALKDMFENREKWREGHMRLEQENRKLREELDSHESWKAISEVVARELQSAQQREQKLIEGLRFYADGNGSQEYGSGQKARDMLKELGVTE